jgi:hypothetical protein
VELEAAPEPALDVLSGTPILGSGGFKAVVTPAEFPGERVAITRAKLSR